MPKNETLTVRIDDWRNWDIEKNRPLRFTATRTDKNEVVELMVFKSSNFDNDPAENIREHLASIDPIGYVGTVQNVTVKYTKEHQGIRQFYLYDMEAVEGANEAPEQPSDPEPVVIQDIFHGIDTNQLRIMRQSTLGYAATLLATKDFDEGKELVTAVINVARLFLDYVITGCKPNFDTEVEDTEVVEDDDVIETLSAEEDE